MQGDAKSLFFKKKQMRKYYLTSKIYIENRMDTINKHCKRYGMNRDIVLEDLNNGKTKEQVFSKKMVLGKIKQSKYYKR